jgi:hypothetical protein
MPFPQRSSRGKGGCIRRSGKVGLEEVTSPDIDGESGDDEAGEHPHRHEDQDPALSFPQGLWSESPPQSG